MKPRIAIFVLIAAVATYLLLLAFDAAAHGEHDWIRARDARTGESCCGEHDCFKVDAAIQPTGYVFAHAGQSYFVPYRETKPSEDGTYRACIPRPGLLRCFFAPPMGS